jgi:hypothetical protein
MIVAMVAVRMVQVAVHQVVGMVAVGNRRVPTVRAVHVLGIVPTALVLRRAGVGIRRRNGNHVLVETTALLMLKMASCK